MNKKTWARFNASPIKFFYKKLNHAMLSLTEQYRTRINTMITEEYGISQELHDEVIPRFQNTLKKEIKNTEIDYSTSTPTKHGYFRYAFLNRKDKKQFVVIWVVYYFKTQWDYDAYCSRHILNNSVAYKDRVFNITIIYINDKPLEKDFYDTIGHEVGHIYQQTLMGKEFGNQYIYNIARQHIQSSNDYERYLAWVIYGSTQSEQEAMINGFYNRFKNGTVRIDMLDQEIEESECGMWLKRLYEAQGFLKQHRNDEDLLVVIQKYKKIKDYYTYKYFLYLVRNGISSFERRIARLTCKIKNCFVNEHFMEQLKVGESLLERYFLIKD